MPLSWLGFDPTSFLYIGSRRPELQSARFAEHGGSVTLYFDPLPSDTAGDPAATDPVCVKSPHHVDLQARAEAHAAAEDAALVYRGQPGKPVIEPAE